MVADIAAAELDAVHERILPLKGYEPHTNQTLGELIRRARLGV